ncbi:MAG: hypothetical protein WKF33_02340 [Thermoleophilaceae bacterium]
MLKRQIMAVVGACALSIGFAAPAQAAPGGNSAGDSLVNVQVGDVTLLVPVAVAANLCDINANVLAKQERKGGATCTATAESLASPGNGHGNGHSGGNKAGDSLVNVQVGDVTAALPVGIAANLCDINVNFLANQVREGGATCTATASTVATPGNGPATVPGGGSVAEDSLVNVQIGDVEVLVPVALAANLCDINVNILADQEREGGATCTATAESLASPGIGDGQGGGNTAGDSLVNVQIGDVTVALPIALAANLCDINVNVLAEQEREGGATCTASSSAKVKKD